MKVHAEIQYDNEEGLVHSDICPFDCDSNNIKEELYRKLLHKFLDEWLDNSNGTGGFYIKNENYSI